MWTWEELREIGVDQYGFLRPEELGFQEDIRRICQGNSCRQYGRTWACPPAVGTVAECRARCLRYGQAMVFSGAYPLEDSFDLEGMLAGHRAFKSLCDRLDDLARPKFADYLLLSNEGCQRCQRCTYPAQPCRMPERLFPSLEGFGLDVSALAARCGLNYHGDGRQVRYFGMLLY